MKEKLKTVFALVKWGCVLLTGIIILSALTPFPNILAKPLIVEPKIEKGDVILVLSGGVYPNGSLSYFTLERVIHGVTLYKSGFAEKIIFSGGVSMGGNGVYDSEAMAKTAISLGVNKEDIILEKTSRNTKENLINSKKIMEENGFKKALLVTSAIHIYRSTLIAKAIGMETLPASPPPFENYRESPIDRLLLFYFTIREYGALLIFKLASLS